MNKQSFITTLLTVLMSMTGAKTFAHDIEVKNEGGVTIYYEWIKNNTELSVSRRGFSDNSYLNEYSGNVVIPESVDYLGITYRVTSINYNAFSNCSNLTSITIPKSVIYFYSFSLSGCSNITSIKVENNNPKYDSRNDCNAIIETATNTLIAGCKNTIIPNSVTSIAGGAFRGCNSLATLTIPNNITSIGGGAFYGCSGLTSITVESGNSKYDSRNDCNAIIETSSNTLIAGCKNTTVPNEVTSIGANAFGGCVSLTSIDIPNSVTSIGESAFSLCSGLTSIDIPNGVTSIGEDAFCDCSSLATVKISRSVTHISSSAFSDCKDLTYVLSEIEDLFSIGSSVFSGIPSKAILVVPAGMKDKYKSTNGWNVFQNIFENGEGGEIGQDFEMDGIHYKIGENNTVSVIEKFRILPSNPYHRDNIYSGDIVIPNQVVFAGKAYNVTSIGSVAFQDSGLKSISIPSSMTSIDAGSFSYCQNLTSIRVESGNQKYDSRNNCNAIIETSSNTLIVGGINTTFPSNVTSIGTAAFVGRGGLTSIDIPNSVKTIGSYAFYACIGLTSITIPNSVTSIEENAFYACSGLTSLTIPNFVTSIGNYAFESCSGLTTVTIPNSVTSIGNRAFAYCSGLTSITIPNSVTSIDNSFYYCSGLTSVTIPSSVISINGNPFEGCSSLTSIKVESSNPKYDSRNDCNAVIETSSNTLISGCKNTIIPNGITSIDAAFWGCSTLISITIPKSVTSIVNGAFYCLGLKSIILDSENPFSISEYSFMDPVLGGFPKDAQLIVPKGTKAKYLAAKGWNQFTNIVEKTGIEGDANNDGALNDTDVNNVESFILGETPTVFVRSAADMNGDEKIDVVDIVLMQNIINNE